MQLKLPIFPKEAKLISPSVGVCERDGLVQYIVNGLPVYAHSADDYRAFRFITSNFIAQGLCRKVDVQRAFCVSEDSVWRYYNKFKKEGAEGFFGADARKGRPYKIVGEKRQRIQMKLDKGQSINSIAKEEKVYESAIRYQIKMGYLKKKSAFIETDSDASLSTGTEHATSDILNSGIGSSGGNTPNERDAVDRSSPLGIAATRVEERVMASLGAGGHAKPSFESNEAVCDAGVLFLLPALLAQGLLKTKELYQLPPTHYYGLESVVLTLAFMALARIKNPEQLKQCKPGELGRIIGLDRVPEVKCLREKLHLLSQQNKATEFNNLLIQHWYHKADAVQQDAAFLYIDGHVRIYYGEKANLPATFVSRQKLCLSATTEYWINDAVGNPVMVVLGEVNEHLIKVIEENIIPQLMEAELLKPISSVEENSVQCTFIFDREGYAPDFFWRLWTSYRIAVITYRKNVKDVWQSESFQAIDTQVLGQIVTMQLCERQITLSGHTFREIRRLSEDGHQTAIITTHPTLPLADVAGRMFGRWSQENFFRYLMQDYDFDKMVEFGTEAIDLETKVVNPEYRKVTSRLKKLREKIRRLEAKFYPLVEDVMNKTIDDLPALTDKQMEYKQMLDRYKEQERELVIKRQQIPARIALKEMPQQIRYNKLKTESKLFMNIIKMICYRAETAVAALITPFLSKAMNEKRMFVKQLVKSCADLIPDYNNKTLTIVLHTLSTPRYNRAAQRLAELLNETETIFPGTDLRMIFKTRFEAPD